MSAEPLVVALGQYDIGWHDPDTSLSRAAALVERAAGAGAQLVVLPEMCTTGFTMDSGEQSEPLSGPSVATLAEIARSHGVHLLAGVATREDRGGTGFFNSALLFGPDGELEAHYRKQRLFAYAGEDGYYSPGESPVVATVRGVRIGLFICFDLRFPELFRAVANEIDAIALIASWPAARRTHWDVLSRARSIENLCYMIAVNRSGEGGGVEYDGGSVAYGPWGDPVTEREDGLLLARIDPAEVARVRASYPFLAECRTAVLTATG
jgi:predicted amidohydrolase